MNIIKFRQHSHADVLSDLTSNQLRQIDELALEH
jgi:hypothetical protein